MLPIKFAIWANTREEPALSCILRFPKTASASSIITATGAIARRIFRTFSKFDSVVPCHCVWKFLSRTIGIPISPANAETRKDFPVPIGPEIKYPIGSTSVLPCLSAFAIDLKRFFTNSCPAINDKSCSVSKNSSKPPASFSIISCFFLRRYSKVIGTSSL